jgi:hypothetical protein
VAPSLLQIFIDSCKRQVPYNKYVLQYYQYHYICPTYSVWYATIHLPPPAQWNKCLRCIDDGVGESDAVNNGAPQFFCELRDSAKNETPVPPLQLPRYRLGRLCESALNQVHLLQVDMKTVDAPQLAYYSSMGALDAMDAASVAR